MKSMPVFKNKPPFGFSFLLTNIAHSFVLNWLTLGLNTYNPKGLIEFNHSLGLMSLVLDSNIETVLFLLLVNTW